MKFFIFNLFILGFFFSSCADTRDHSKNIKPVNFNKNKDIKFDFISEKDDALDALDKVQISGKNLYSTFKNIPHDCKNPVSTLNISKEEFEDALLYLFNQYYPNLSFHEKNYLASTASKAEELYAVTICGSTTDSLEIKKTFTPPRKGVWIFYSFLNQRDLIINW